MAKNKTYYTPAGPAAWIKVYEPDTRYKDGGEFAVDLFLSPKDAKETLAIYDKVVADTVKEEGGKPTKDVQYQVVSTIKPGEDGIPYLEKLASTGFHPDPTWYRLKFRVDHKVTPKDGKPFENHIKVVDKAGKDLPEGNDSIGNGSEIRVAYEPYGWAVSGKVGCKMRLKGIQVLDLVAYANNSIEFEVEEDDIAF